MTDKKYTVVTTVPRLFGKATAVPGGKLVEFDAAGRAEVDAETARYLTGIKGFETDIKGHQAAVNQAGGELKEAEQSEPEPAPEPEQGIEPEPKKKLKAKGTKKLKD